MVVFLSALYTIRIAARINQPLGVTVDVIIGGILAPLCGNGFTRVITRDAERIGVTGLKTRGKIATEQTDAKYNNPKLIHRCVPT